ncbi:hypothetical protein Dimus_014217 [Dionaea muscipula]
MGLVTSFMGRGVPSTGILYDRFIEKTIEKNITTFEGFHAAILDIFHSLNSALPGKHYDVPSRKDVEACFKRWQEAKDKKEVFVEFFKDNVKPSKLDNFSLITGLLTPPAAMAAKKAGESVSQLKLITAIPDVIFVPSVTVLALISVKLSRKIFLKNMASP